MKVDDIEVDRWYWVDHGGWRGVRKSRCVAKSADMVIHNLSCVAVLMEGSASSNMVLAVKVIGPVAEKEVPGYIEPPPEWLVKFIDWLTCEAVAWSIVAIIAMVLYKVTR